MVIPPQIIMPIVVIIITSIFFMKITFFHRSDGAMWKKEARQLRYKNGLTVGELSRLQTIYEITGEDGKKPAGVLQ